VLDRIAALAAAALLSLSSLLHRETALVGVELVTRSSLTGYDVGGQHGLDAVEAARALAERAVAEMDAAVVARPAPRPHVDLLTPPHRVLGGRVSETWKAGAAAQSRLRALRGCAIGHHVEEIVRKGRGFYAAHCTVEIRYPAGHAVPAIEVVS